MVCRHEGQERIPKFSRNIRLVVARQGFPPRHAQQSSIRAVKSRSLPTGWIDTPGSYPGWPKTRPALQVSWRVLNENRCFYSPVLEPFTAPEWTQGSGSGL